MKTNSQTDEIKEIDTVMTDLFSKLSNTLISPKKDNQKFQEILQEMDDLQQKIYKRMDELSQN